MTGDRPLAGIRVLDLTRLLPGPMCTLHLADMGADVIKVEDPGAGDYARWIGRRARVNSLDFLAMNRNKRAINLDLKHPAGAALFLRLAETADVVVEGFRPGVADRLGVGYAAVAAVNPRAVYCSITGYGQTGPLADKAGHDVNYLALSGALDQTGAAGGPPAIGNFQIGDLAGGTLTAAMSICAALVGTQRTGRGRHLDVAIADAVLTHMVIAAATLAGEGATAPRGRDKLTGGLPCYGVYATADGRWLAVGALEPKFWVQVCAALGRPDLADRGHLEGDAGELVRAEVAAVIASRPLAHWADLFAPLDCCVTPVLTLEEAMESAHALARGLVVTHEHPVEGPVRQFAPPVRMGAGPVAVDRPAPMQGEHTDAVLREAGLSEDEIARHRAEGVI